MRFSRNRKKSRKRYGKSSFTSNANNLHLLELIKREEEKLNAETPNNVAVSIADKNLKDGNQSETKVDVPRILMDLDKQDKKNDGEDNMEDEVAEFVKTPQPIVPMQGSAFIDMSKDEWTLGEILDLNISEIPFLVEKLMPLHTLNVLAGQSEIGKSTLYTQLSLAIVRGDSEFLGCKLNVAHKKVIVVSTEDGPISLSFRTNKQLSQTSCITEFKDRLIFITNQEDLESRIERYLEKSKVDLIIMDAFGDVFTGGDINASNSVRRYLNNYVSFIQKYGCTVLFVHHVGKGKQANKQEKDQLLGSVGIEGKMRNVLMLSIVNDQHQLKIAKGNYVNREDKKVPMYLNFDNESLTFSRAEGLAIPIDSVERDVAFSVKSRSKRKPGRQKDHKLYDQTIKLYEEGKSQVEIAKIVGRDKSTICKYIKEYRSGLNKVA